MPDPKPFPASVTDAAGCKWDVTPEGQLIQPYVPVEYPKAIVNSDGSSVVVQTAEAEHAHHAKSKPSSAPSARQHTADVAHDADLKHDAERVHDANLPKPLPHEPRHKAK